MNMRVFNMAVRDGKQHFPLQSIQDVVDLFKDTLRENEEPNLSKLSIILGIIENTLTVNRALPSALDSQRQVQIEPIFPVVDVESVEALYTKFKTLIKGHVDLLQYPQNFANRDLVKRVSDVVWSSLTRSFYKDRAHLQSLYSFLTGNKLDCFGVAFAVVAGCQILGYHDVHLALSEDHAWVVFGEDGEETAEVTWHGKGNEDKRGLPINTGVAERNWLYLNGHPVICSRQLEVAAIVSGINPSINSTMDSVEMGSLQQELLWLLYDMGHLEKYPMALGNLGDCEEISRTADRPSSIKLFEKAVQSAKTYYMNHHVYPYTYLGGYLCRKGQYKGAIQAWSDAASVIKMYNYTREDEEIYKEFLEIANDLIPAIVKNACIEAPSSPEQVPLLYDPHNYANFLRFYDGICQWEEDSSTPVLHITWAQHFISSLSKFAPHVKRLITILAEGEEDNDDESSSDDDSSDDHIETKQEVKKASRGRPPKQKNESLEKPENNRNDADHADDAVSQPKVSSNGTLEDSNGNSNCSNGRTEEQIKSTIQELASRVDEDSQNEAPNPNIAALAHACSESILNPDYLISGGDPFTTASSTATVPTTTTDSRVDLKEFLSTKSNGTPFINMSLDSVMKAESPSDLMLFHSRPCNAHLNSETDPKSFTDNNLSSTDTDCKNSGKKNRFATSHTLITHTGISHSPRTDSHQHVTLNLYSKKMKGLRKILCSEKLNASAIKLQLTAQSQVAFRQQLKRGCEDTMGIRSKRLRRE